MIVTVIPSLKSPGTLNSVDPGTSWPTQQPWTGSSASRGYCPPVGPLQTAAEPPSKNVGLKEIAALEHWWDIPTKR